jgi:hypothetical protein
VLVERATIADARLVIAREYGFPTWRGLVEGLREESAGRQGARQDRDRVAAALAAIGTGDAVALKRLLDAHPELVHLELGAGGSLLGEVAEPDVFGTSLGRALGVDRACVDLLIERGSDLDGPLGLAACFDRLELVEILLAAGAQVDARGIHGITPLETAIYHASRASVEVLAAIELVPRQDVLDEALVHAAQNERPEAVAWLLDQGADPNAGPYQGCGALHLAAAFGAIKCVRLLIAAGADIDKRNDFNGDNALGWAEYALEQERPGDPGVTAVRDYLRSLGPRPAVWGA